MSDKYLNSTGIATIRDWVKGLIKNNFSKVSANGTNVAASNSDDTLTLSPGSNVQISGNASNKVITISATDTTYSAATTSAAGLMSAADKTKLNSIESGAEQNSNDISVLSVGDSVDSDDITLDGYETLALAIHSGSDDAYSWNQQGTTLEVDFTVKDTTYSNAATNAAGLMSSSDKTKLNGIESGAEVNQNAFSAVGVGSSSVAHTLSAGSKSAQFNLIIKTGTNDGLSVSNNTAMFTVKGTTYSNATTSAAGLMSSSDKTKLNGIATGAEVNVQADWNQTTTTNDAYIKNKPTNLNQFTNGPGYQTASEVQALIDASITTTYKYKGSVASYSNLPASGNTTGDVWNVEDTGMNYAWTGSAWDALGSIVDLSAYWATADLVAFTANEVTAILTA